MNKKYHIVAYYFGADPEVKVKYHMTLSCSAKQAIDEVKEEAPDAEICMVAAEAPADEWQ